MATTCRTADGDMLDSLCYHVYGHLLGCVEATLDANPGLADEQQPFRAGLLISFPDMPVVNVEQVRLWIDRPLTRNPALAGFFFLEKPGATEFPYRCRRHRRHPAAE